MTLSNNMKFFDINYLEFYSALSCSASCAPSTTSYAYDNRADGYTVDFTANSGSFLCYWSGATYYIDTIILSNHNFSGFNFLYHTGSTWTTLVSYAGETEDTKYYSFATLGISGFGIEFTATTGGNGQFGEFIATKEKFALNYNPSEYIPSMNPILSANRLWNGKASVGKRASFFEAKIGWANLIGSQSTLTNTDLQNMTELIRTNSTFLFWPNANNTFTNMYTWRKQDIFKCQILDEVTYEFISPAVDYVIKGTGYKMVEVK